MLFNTIHGLTEGSKSMHVGFGGAGKTKVQYTNVIYHYFPTKNVILFSVGVYLNKSFKVNIQRENLRIILIRKVINL